MKTSVQSTRLWIIPSSVLLLVILISGCDQGIVQIDEENSTLSQGGSEFSVSYVDGRLVFADMEAFANFMDSLIHSEYTSTKELGITDDFMSLYASTSKLEEEDYENSDAGYTATVGDFEIVEDPFFASVLNEFGEIQIGTSVFKYTRSYVYETSESNIELLDNFPSRNSDQTAFYGKHDDVQGVKIHEIKRVHHHAADLAGKVMARGTRNRHFENKRRLLGDSWITDFHVYQSAGARSRSQRKKWIKWVSNTIEEVNLSAEYTLWTRFTSSPVSGTRVREGRNVSEVSVVLFWDYGPSIFLSGTITTRHSGRRGNVERECKSEAET
ncbi:MAG: hypothetical protein OXL40_05745 [Bacteroidota bacterium]|nr:hypothetical protein [Bacteroidota bacterium]